MKIPITHEEKKQLIDFVLSEGDLELKSSLLEFIKQGGIPHGFEYYPPLVHFLNQNNLTKLISEASQKYHVAKRVRESKDISRWSILDM